MKKQTQSTYIPIFFLCLCLGFLCYGCLGLGGSGGSGNTFSINPNSHLSVSGRAFFYERQLYGDIPIELKNIQKETVAVTTTDSNGNYSFSNIDPGVYYVSATTGESEVTFGNMIQVTGQGCTELSPTALLSVKNIIIDKISSDSFHIEFDTNRACRATVEYGPTGGYVKSKTLGQAGQTFHETTLTGLNFLTEYEITIYMTGDDGQEFVLNGLTAKTIGLAGCNNLAVNINNGAYETKNQTVTLNLYAEDCKQMRISESYTLDDASWVNYSETYQYSFSNKSNGIKRLYVQFKNENGTLSPIESDSIVFSSSGYIGIWINDGEAITNKTEVEIKAIYPNATQMIISDNSSFSNVFWESYLATRKWELTNEDGLKTIYCKFKGGKANPNEVFTASIIYDTTPPKVEMAINNGDKYVATTSVDLSFSYSSIPSQMKISNDKEPAATEEWVNFNSDVKWILTSGEGNKKVYAIFKDSVGNEYGPISSEITIDTVAPTGNSISILQTEESTSTAIGTFTLQDNLPVYLHFNIADESTKEVFYYIGLATTTVPTEFNNLSSPYKPIELNLNNLSIGDNKMWAYFIDETGNKSSVESILLRIEGPEINITPASVNLTAEQEQTFTTEYKNITSSEVGSIKWMIASGSGIINSDGIYTAPSLIYATQTVIIRGESSSIPSLYGFAQVNLKTSYEIAYLQNNGEFTKEPLSKQIMPGEIARFTILILHSDQGIKLTANPTIGYATVSNPVKSDYGSIATITYTAPNSISDVANITLNFNASEKPSLTGKVNCTVSTGANITLTPSAYVAQRNSPINVQAEVANTSENSITWKISPITAGSFSSNTSTPEITTTNNHVVTFYPSTPNKITQASITAEIGEASKSINISVYPPLSITIDPLATDSMPLIEAMPFTVNGFEYMITGVDETLKWEFKNANSPDFMPADGKTYADRGSLTIITNNQVHYKRPSKLPSSLDDSASDTIQIRATSLADPSASSTAQVYLADKVKVFIYDDVEKTNLATSVPTVIEVGSLQFYAKVTPEVIGNTTVKWTVNDVTNSESYGSIDSNGKYTAPSSLEATKVKIRATSNYDSSAFAEVEVALSDFWVPKRDNMIDESTGEPMPITKIFVDPTTKIGEDFIVYAGTGAESQFGYYGLWVATFSDEIGDTSGGYWQGIKGLSSNRRVSSLSLLIYDIALDMKGNIYVSTGDGIYYVPKYGVEAEAEPLILDYMVGDPFPSSPLTSLTTAYNSNTKRVQLLAGCNEGVYLFELSDYNTIFSSELLIRTQTYYRVWETRSETKQVMLGTQTQTITETDSAYSNPASPNPILSTVRSVLYDNLNKSLYFGTASNRVYYCPSLAPNMQNRGYAKTFSGTSGVDVTYSYEVFTYDNLSYPVNGSVSGVPLALALDKINTNTLWVATTNGVSRSIDFGMNWSNYAFSGGVNTNCRCIIVDPNNTINVMSGSEDGLYRTTNGGSSWTRIRSGLGNYKTITSLTQAAGAAGKRRKVWVGTSGGVFVGKQSLSLE